jgi:hypothetical protein
MHDETHIKDLQVAYISKTIREVLAIHPVTYDQLLSKSIKKLIPSTQPNSDDKNRIKEEIFKLLIEGKIDINKGKVSVEGRYRVNSVEEDYKLNNIESLEGEKNINGSHEFLSVGSERYPFFWSTLELNTIVVVELIAEPQNKKDPLAVAICIDKKPYAYLPREEASNYHSIVMKANSDGFRIVASAIISTYEHNPSVKLFKLSLVPFEVLNRQLNKTL